MGKHGKNKKKQKMNSKKYFNWKSDLGGGNKSGSSYSQNNYSGGSTYGYQQSVVKRYKELELRNSPSLIITKEVQSQINYFHNKVGPIEWSGFLLYEQEGDLNDIGGMKLTAKHIHILDIGSAAFTEIRDYDPFEIVDDIGERALSYKMGIIHTHHNMDTFFSGTDTGCLHENAENYPFLLSLIVNFKVDYKAKIAFLAQDTDHKRELILNERLGGGKLSMGEKKGGEDTLVLCECKILFEQDDAVTKRFDSLKKKAATVWTPKTYTPPPAVYPYGKHKNEKEEEREHPELEMYKDMSRFFDEEDKKEKKGKKKENTHLDLTMDNIDVFMVKVITADPSASGTLIYGPLKAVEESTKDEAQRDMYLDMVEDKLLEWVEEHFGKVGLKDSCMAMIAEACIKRLDVYQDVFEIARDLRVIFEDYAQDVEPVVTKKTPEKALHD
jgi:hypothetical protein